MNMQKSMASLILLGWKIVGNQRNRRNVSSIDESLGSAMSSVTVKLTFRDGSCNLLVTSVDFTLNKFSYLLPVISVFSLLLSFHIFFQ